MGTHGLSVFGFDPTPRSVRYVRRRQRRRKARKARGRFVHTAEGVGTSAFKVLESFDMRSKLYAVLSQLYSKVGITYGAAAGLPSASAPPTPAALPYRSAPPLPPLGTAIAAAIQPPAQCFDTSRPATAPSGAEPSHRT